MIKTINGFTIVELLVIMAVIGVLSAVSAIGFGRYQTDSRDSQRSSKTAILAEALEKYYDKNGEYPGCVAISDLAVNVTTAVLPGVELNTLLTPKNVVGDTNSIECTNITGAAGEADVFAYVGDGSAACNSGSACLGWTLKYKEEGTGQIKTITSRRSATIAAPDIDVTASPLNSSQINITWTATGGATGYRVQRATNNTFSANVVTQAAAGTSHSATGLNTNSLYYFRVQASVNGLYSGNWSNTASGTTTCPSGFTLVPGSSTYGTTNFCVMKYEAKQASATVPISQAAGLPWVNITTANAATYSQNVVGCTGCHIITEAEWLTIAKNVLSVASNWSGGAVGSGFIYSGHNNGTPNNSLAANASDTNGYSGTGDVAPSNQRRTLTLTNGGVIWDLAGNVNDKTAGGASSGWPGISNSTWTWSEWNAVPILGTLSPNPFPSYGTPAASGWTAASHGIGKLYSNYNDTGIRCFDRGGSWFNWEQSGILTLDLAVCTFGNWDTQTGFRVAR